MTGYTQVSANIRKTWGLMFMFFALITSMGWFLSYYFGNPSILYFAVALSIFMNFSSYFFADKVALSISGAHEAKRGKSPEEDRAIHVTEVVSLAAGIPTPKIFVMNDSSLNAFATGRDPKHSAVCYTTGLLKELDKVELEGVAAHEISHVKNRDILVMTIVVTLIGLVTLVADLFFRGMFGGNSDNRNLPLMLIGILFMIISVLFAYLIKFAISRKREYMADASGALITRYPEGLASALEKISGRGNILKNAHTSTAHLFISSPFDADKKKTKKGSDFIKSITRLFSTHPPLETRIKALRDMDNTNLAG